MRTHQNANEYGRIEQMLKDRIGLDPAALGPSGIEYAVAGRMRQLGIDSGASYAALVSSSTGELEALIEQVVIPETWFFRDHEPFVFLAEFIRAEWKPQHGREILRILSAPCATGEEPYSIAMVCLDSGLRPDQFLVDAVDVNARFLHKAGSAVYGRNSFRGTDLNFRDRYFTCDGHQYSLKPEARACVRFSRANILEPESLPALAPYHVVFCRNLLIYLHEQARAKIMAALERLLADGGLLFIGHAELNPLLLGKYAAVQHCGSFALRKPAPAPIEKLAGDTKPPRSFPATGETASDFTGAAREPAPFETASKMPGRKSGRTLPENIEHATQLANAGRLTEAAGACAQIIQANRHNAGAHFLMGIIREAQGDNHSAEECFNRAIYLDANFADAIIHLAMLKEQCGDKHNAGLLRRRAAAIHQDQTPA